MPETITPPTIPIRNESFAFDARVPRHWHGGQKAITAFFDNLSIFFPAGERFFIASVRAHRHRVTDKTLHAAMRAFCGQEGVHSREHEHYNAMLERQGYPIQALERRIRRVLARAEKRLPKRMQLGVTCALEHFTALMAHMLLRDPRVLEGAHPVMAALWRWHAAEENEHKSVAYDVYLAAGGTYGERCLLMVHATLLFWLLVIEHQFVMMHADGVATSPREWWSLVRFLFVDPGAMRKVVRLYFEYFRPDFHPNDIDASDLIEAWRRAHEASPMQGAA